MTNLPYDQIPSSTP